MCANEINVKNWFKEYEKVLADLNITSPEQIWSGDETGVQNVPKEEFVLAQKYISASQIVSGEQGGNFYNPGLLSMVLVMCVHQ